MQISTTRGARAKSRAFETDQSPPPSLATHDAVATAELSHVSKIPAAVPTPAPAPVPVESGASLDIGMNLDGITYYNSEHALIDRFKTSGAWTAQGQSGDLAAAVPLDANGYPTGIPAGGNVLYTMVSLDPVALETTDRYVLTYEGKANFFFNNATIVSNEDGKLVIDFTGSNESLQIKVDGLEASDPLHDIHLVREDQVSLFNEGEIFNPDFIEKASQWSTLRFMEWGRTNNSPVTSWGERTTLDSASWSVATATTTVPIEVMVRLANETHVDMWYNIPAEADDDFVEKTLTYIRDNLDPTLTLKLEYSNEVWNWGFQQSHYALEQGDLLFGTDVNGNGVIEGDNPQEHVADGWMQFYGYRSAQIAAISAEVFGTAADTRVDNIISTIPAWVGIEQSVFHGVEEAGLGTVAALFDSYAITSYFGNDLSTAGSNPADAAIVLGWAASGAAGLDKAFEQLETGDLLSTNSSLAWLQQLYAAQGAIAADNGLDLVTYEGGAHLTPGSFATADRAVVEDFFSRLMNDPRMGELYTQMADDFAAAGGTELTAFKDSGGSSQYGYWGVLDSTYDDSSPRYDSLVGSANENGVVLTGTVLADTLTGGDENDLVSGGAGSDRLTGGDGADTLVGGAGNDALDGGVGIDHAVGGAGNDTYTVNSTYDFVIEVSGGGTDKVFSTANYTLSANVENLQLTGTAIHGSGNDIANAITGNGSANILAGLAGNDTLSGGAGDDTLVGGAGRDVLYGGAGKDTFAIGTGDSAAATPDLIADFSHLDGDRVDLSGIDAVSGTTANDAFAFIGSAAFSGTAGELRVVAAGPLLWAISGDQNGDGTADFAVQVTQPLTLTGADFVL
jgi:Ca2+-binding RTX toxin-like protein